MSDTSPEFDDPLDEIEYYEMMELDEIIDKILAERPIRLREFNEMQDF